MSDRIKGFVVVLEKDMRDDDSESIKNAILMIRGVAKVDSSVVNSSDYINRSQVRIELQNKVFKVLYP